MFLSSKRLLFKQITLLIASLFFPKRIHAKSSFWHTIALVQQDLFPDTQGVPTLHNIHAKRYLKGVMHDVWVRHEEKDFIRNGEQWLHEASQQHFRKNYTDLKPLQRQKILRVISKERWGERWIEILLSYIMEALLCDPVYGGNSAEVGWKWLHHTPGLPRPKKALV